MERQTYKQVLDKLAGVDVWLSDLGFPKKANRIYQHISNICKLEESWRDETLKKKFLNEAGHVQLFWSLIEAAEFADTYIALRDFDPNSLKEKLREVLKGPADPNEETTTSSIGRNTMFELNLASRLFCCGVPVYLQTNPDIFCEVNHRKIYIQCKRPFIERNIPNNISVARKQLTRDLNDSGDGHARGVIAISVSHTLNPGDKLFIAKTYEEMKGLLGDYVQNLGEKYSSSWKYIVDTRIIGILFHLITPAAVAERDLLFVAQQVVMFSLLPAGSFDGLLFRQFYQILLKKA